MAAYVSIKWDIKYTFLRWGGGISGPIFAQMLLISRGSHHSVDEKCRIIKETNIANAILNKDFCSWQAHCCPLVSAIKNNTSVEMLMAEI